MKAYLAIAVALTALSTDAMSAEPRKLLSRPKLLSHAPAKPEAKHDITPAIPPAGMIGAWMDEGRVITANYETARKMALAENRPLVVLSKLKPEDVGPSAQDAPHDAVITISDTALPQPGVFTFEPKRIPAGKTELVPVGPPAPPTKAAPPQKVKLKQASYRREDPVQEGCPGGMCRRRLRR